MGRHGTAGQGVIARYGKMRYNTAGCGKKVGAKTDNRLCTLESILV